MKITVGQSGTGGGFEKFCAGETDISDASRPIKHDEEAPVCEKAGVKYARGPDRQRRHRGRDEQGPQGRLPDHRRSSSSLGARLEGQVAQGARSLPAGHTLSLYGPGTDSGTFDFFTGEINGEEGASREDYEASEDDNQLVTGVAGDKGGLGYFGFSYYEQNQDKLNLVGVGEDAGSCVKPSSESIQDGSYKPLSRPLFMYPSDEGDGAARGEGLHGLRRRQPGRHRRGGADRPDDRRAG